MTLITGFPGFGSPGKEGESGISGKSLYYTEFDLSDSEQFADVQRRISENRNISNKSENKISRTYLEGDNIIDYNNTLHVIKTIDNTNNIIEIIQIQQGFKNLLSQSDDFCIMNKLILQKNIPSIKKLEEFDGDYLLTLLNKDGKFISLYSQDNNEKFVIKTVDNNIGVDGSVLLKNAYVPENSPIVNYNSLFVKLYNIINSCSIIDNNLYCSYNINELKITELHNYINGDNTTITCQKSFERIIKNYNNTIIKSLSNDSNYLKFYIKDNNMNVVFYIISKDDIKNFNELLNITSENQLNITDNIIDIKLNNNNSFSVSFIYKNDIIGQPWNFINSENTEISSNKNVINVNCNLSANITNKENITRSFELYNKRYYITFANPYYIDSNPNILDVRFSAYTNDDAKYLQYNSVKNGIPCNSFITVSSIDIKDVENNCDKIDLDISIDYSASTFLMEDNLDDSDKSVRISAAIVYGENIANDINIETFNNAPVKVLSNKFNENKTLKLVHSINKNDIYIGDDEIKLASSAPKLIILTEFNEPYLCDVCYTINGNVKTINDSSVNFNTDIVTRVVPWELTAFALNTKSVEKDVRAYNKVYRPYVPYNLRNLKIEITNYNKRYFNFYDNENSFYTKDLKHQFLSDGLYSEMSLLKFGYNEDNYTEEIEINPTNKISNISYKVNYSQFDDDILYPVRTGINININANDIKTSELFFNSVATSGTTYAPTSADGIVLGKSYIEYDSIYNGNNNFLSCAEWAYNATIKDKNNNKGNFITYDCKLSYPSDCSLNKFALNNLFEDNVDRYIPYSIFFNIEPRVITKSSGEYMFNAAVNLLRCPKVVNNTLRYYNNDCKQYIDKFDWIVPTSVRTLKDDGTITYNDL